MVNTFIVKLISNEMKSKKEIRKDMGMLVKFLPSKFRFCYPDDELYEVFELRSSWMMKLDGPVIAVITTASDVTNLFFDLGDYDYEVEMGVDDGKGKIRLPEIGKRTVLGKLYSMVMGWE